MHHGAWLQLLSKSAFLGTRSRIILLVSRLIVFIVLHFLTNGLWGKYLSAYRYIFSFHLIIYRATVRIVKLYFFSFKKNKIKQQKLKTFKCALRSLSTVTVLSPVVHSWHCLSLAALNQQSLLCSSTWAPETPLHPRWNESESCQTLVDKWSSTLRNPVKSTKVSSMVENRH